MLASAPRFTPDHEGPSVEGIVRSQSKDDQDVNLGKNRRGNRKATATQSA